MKKFSRLVSLAALPVVIGALTACGGNGGSNYGSIKVGLILLHPAASSTYDKNFYDGIINLKKEIILKKGIQRKVENGTVRGCPMSCLVTRQGIIPRTINSKLCDLCILWYKPENSENFYCVGHTNDNLPSWFVQADVINNKYLPINEAVRKIQTFKENIKRYSL